MTTTPNRLLLRCALLGALFVPACSHDAEAGESDAARELREARQALGRWAELEADEFEQAARRTLRATEARIAELRERAAKSELAEDTRQTLAALERQREQLAKQLDGLGSAAADELEAARKAIVDGVGEAADRLSKAWRALSGN